MMYTSYIRARDSTRVLARESGMPLNDSVREDSAAPNRAEIKLMQATRFSVPARACKCVCVYTHVCTYM